MIIINGKVYHDNVTIVNGRVIEGNSCDDTTSKKFDETKKVSANGVNRIIIDSNINVKVSASSTNDVTAHLHGYAIMDSNLKLSVTRVGDEVHISVESEGASISYINMSTISTSSVVINNFSSGSNGGLTLDVKIPTKAFEKIFVESKNANIDVTSSVTANTVTVDNMNGNIDISAIFQTLSIDCKNGNVNIDSEARCDVRLNVANKNGNVDVTLGNIGTSKVSIDCKNGSCKNNPRLRGIYTVSGYITSKNGNVKLR